MYMPGTGVKVMGRPDWWVSNWYAVMFSRRPPRNSGMISETLVVSENCPRSIAASDNTLVKVLLTEKML